MESIKQSEKYLKTISHEKDYEDEGVQPSFREFYDQYKDEYTHKEKIHVSGKHAEGREFKGKHQHFFVTVILFRIFDTQ